MGSPSGIQVGAVMAKLDVCERCGKYRRLENHHVFPLRYFSDNGVTIPLCRACHDEVEEMIHEAENGHALSQPQYVRLALKFLGRRNDARNQRRH